VGSILGGVKGWQDGGEGVPGGPRAGLGPGSVELMVPRPRSGSGVASRRRRRSRKGTAGTQATVVVRSDLEGWPGIRPVSRTLRVSRVSGA